VKVRGQMDVGSRTSRTGSVLVLLAITLSGIPVCVFFARFYLLREALLFLAIAAFLAFFVATLVLLGILVCSAGRTALLSLKKAKSRIFSQPELGAFAEVRPILSRESKT